MAGWLHQQSGRLRVNLHGLTPNWSLYFTDTLTLAKTVNVTVSGRYNWFTIDNAADERDGSRRIYAPVVSLTIPESESPLPAAAVCFHAAKLFPKFHHACTNLNGLNGRSSGAGFSLRNPNSKNCWHSSNCNANRLARGGLCWPG